MHDEGVLADPANAGALSQLAFEDGDGVDAGSGVEWLVEFVADALDQVLEHVLDDDVVVLAPGVHGDAASGF